MVVEKGGKSKEDFGERVVNIGQKKRDDEQKGSMLSFNNKLVCRRIVREHE